MILIENEAKLSYIENNALGAVARTRALPLPALLRRAQDLTLRALTYFRIYPHIFFSFMPFKIYEFHELLKGIRLFRSDHILDIGCGGGLQTLILGRKCGKIVGIDIKTEDISRAQRKAEYMGKRIDAEFLCTRLEEAGFVSNSFDKIFSICVLEHIANYREVLQEAHRILKSGGQMVFSVDSLATITDPEAIATHRRTCCVEKYFTAEELTVILREIDFRRIEIYPIFRSDYARRLFLQGLSRSFRFERLSSLISYLRLGYHEKRCRTDQGLFLIAKCVK